MKAKIRKTGEVIEVTRNNRGEYEENDRWRYITEDAAIAAMQGSFS